MGHKVSKGYCLNAQDMEAMRRDGIGWGHDLNEGCFYVESSRPKARRRRWTNIFRGRS